MDHEKHTQAAATGRHVALLLTCSFSMPGLRPTLDICTLERDGAIGAVAGLWKPKERRPTEIILTVRLSHVDEREVSWKAISAVGERGRAACKDATARNRRPAQPTPYSRGSSG